MFSHRYSQFLQLLVFAGLTCILLGLQPYDAREVTQEWKITLSPARGTSWSGRGAVRLVVSAVFREDSVTGTYEYDEVNLDLGYMNKGRIIGSVVNKHAHFVLLSDYVHPNDGDSLANNIFAFFDGETIQLPAGLQVSGLLHYLQNTLAARIPDDSLIMTSSKVK